MGSNCGNKLNYEYTGQLLRELNTEIYEWIQPVINNFRPRMELESVKEYERLARKEYKTCILLYKDSLVILRIISLINFIQLKQFVCTSDYMELKRLYNRLKLISYPKLWDWIDNIDEARHHSGDVPAIKYPFDPKNTEYRGALYGKL